MLMLRLMCVHASATYRPGCLLRQDVAIAHGYNNLAESEPRIWGAGSELPLSQLSEAVRLEAAMAGFTEVCFSSRVKPGRSKGCADELSKEAKRGIVSIW